jgi:hypothetical protein
LNNLHNFWDYASTEKRGQASFLQGGLDKSSPYSKGKVACPFFHPMVRLDLKYNEITKIFKV